MATVFRALRSLARAPGFALVAVAALALGIGANTAIFSVASAIFLTPLPYPNAERLVQIGSVPPEGQAGALGFSLPRYELLAERQDVFERLAMAIPLAYVLTGDGDAEQLQAMRVSHAFFPTLGVAPALGRGFTEEEDRAGGEPVVILSHALWERRFGGSADALGRTLVLDGQPHVVVGVMPREASRFPMRQVELWTAQPRTVPFLHPSQIERGGFFFTVVARLKPGVTTAQAQRLLDAVAASYADAHPDHVDAPTGARLTPLLDGLVGDQRGTYALLFAAVGCVLLLAGANVANLVLTRSVGRRKQVAVRFALGARRHHVLAEFVLESVLLALAGGALGLALAGALVALITQLGAEFIPRVEEIALDARVLAYTLILSLATGLLLGLAPLGQLRAGLLAGALKEEGRDATGGRRHNRLRGALMVAEIALSFVLLVGASLLTASFLRLQQVAPGFHSENVLTAFVQVPTSRYADGSAELAELYARLRERAAAIPGVESAALTDVLPLGGFGPAPYAVLGRPVPPLAQQPLAARHIVSAGYVTTLGARLTRGRDFDARDAVGTPPVVLVNEAFARAAFPGTDPIGQRLITGMLQREAEIVGVISDMHHQDLTTAPGPAMYHPVAQRPENFTNLVLRTRGDPASFMAALRAAVREVDPTLPLTAIQPLEAVVAQSVADRRLVMSLLAVFAVVALLLASLGVYSVMAYAVGQRSAEFGVRMALGARPAQLQRLVIGQGLRLTAIGLGIGLVVALAASSLLGALLFGIGATDLRVHGAIAAALCAVAVVACWVPSRRAARVPPMRALRP